MADTWLNLANAVVGNPIPAATINTILANLRVLGGNGVTAPTSDIEALKALVDALVAPTSQAGVPSSTPTVIGQLNVDTTANRLYVATGTGSSADWDKVAVYASGEETITSGAGDLTVTLPWDWSGGHLLIFSSSLTTTYWGATSPYRWETTYAALTDAGYTSREIWQFGSGGSSVVEQVDNETGLPKSATTHSFTLDEATTTRYIKWVVIA